MIAKEKRFTLVKDRKARLREVGLKVTHPRLRILEVLEASSRPLSVQDILDRFGLHVADRATVYRSANTLQKAGVLRRIDLRHGHAAFELNDETRHHHHLVCTRCGKIVDIADCLSDDMLRRVKKKAADFSEITEHTLEFYGICRECAKRQSA